MSRVRTSPDFILPTRMSLRVPPDTPLHFSTLDFPDQAQVDRAVQRIKSIYERQRGDAWPRYLYPPYRQLSDAILALAPGIIQPFEGDGAGVRRLITFTPTGTDAPDEFPSITQLRNLIRHWLERWARQETIRTIIEGEGKAAWHDLLEALESEPETVWQHDILPASLGMSDRNGLAFVALPALLSALLHEQSMTIRSGQAEYNIIWRRAHSGGARGLHLVSQPISRDGHYFAYRLDFSLQTQAGREAPWIFAYLGIQRYITQPYRRGDRKRNISVLVGYNKERFSGGRVHNTTLIRLGVEKRRLDEDAHWAAGVGALLNDVSIRELLSPQTILDHPLRYGGYGQLVDGDEYYVIHAEGRKSGEDEGKNHPIKTGVRLEERSAIMEGVLGLLDGWLEVSPPFQKDIQNPYNTLALRRYDHMVKARKDNTRERGSWREALCTSLQNGAHVQAHLVVLYRSGDFQRWVKPKLDEALMGVDSAPDPLVTVEYLPLPPLLYEPLDAGAPDTQMDFPSDAQKRDQDREAHNKRLQLSYQQKRDEWRKFLHDIPWKPNARKLLLIDSTGEHGVRYDQQIKGAVRDACHREHILSQFLVSRFKLDKKREGELDGESAGRIQNAVLDLLVRQQAILYAPPREIYERAARIAPEVAAQLDVIAFCRWRRTGWRSVHYALAVRLRADGQVDVMLPSDNTRWLPYDAAARRLGVLFSNQRAQVRRDGPSLVRMTPEAMVNFAEAVLTRHLERPTIAVIEAVGWRNGGKEGQCWTQLTNPNLAKYRDVLRFGVNREYERGAPAVRHLLGVVRLRMGIETPQYITAETWTPDEPPRHVRHLTGYIDPAVSEPFHYISLARLPRSQKRQDDKVVIGVFKGDILENTRLHMALKHAQIIEMVPFFVHPDFQSNQGVRQLCRCVHFLRISPAFVMGDIVLPYPMHLGERLIADQLPIIGVHN
ncbi:MAG: DUF3962 domain-containing protein [Anaerolineae bacterium]|nr:DUF3962 domain-containing protein [Anaerolineae bacterium]